MSYYYYVLTSFFGDVPFYEDYVQTDDDIQRIAKLGRMSAVETRQTLIDELKLYVPTIPQKRTYDQIYNEQRMNYCGAAMGWMMIAKMAAWNKDWDEVIYACEHLEDLYGDLSQYPYSDVMFRNKNTPESIFEINHEFLDGGIDYTPPSNLGISSVVMPYPKRDGDSAVFDSVTIHVRLQADAQGLYRHIPEAGQLHGESPFRRQHLLHTFRPLSYHSGFQDIKIAVSTI